MSEDILIPNDALYDVATYKIFIDGVEVDPSLKLYTLSIIRELNRIPMAKIVFRDGDAAKQKFEISEQDHFVPGKKVRIDIGRDGTNTKAFAGVIIKHSVKVKANGNSLLYLECMDEAVKMTIGRYSKYFEKVKDSEIFDELIRKYPTLKSDPEPTNLKHKEVVQHHISDWDFLMLRADANGMLVNVDDGKIIIAKPQIKKESLQINYGSSLLEFEAEMDARNQISEVKAISWDYANQKLFTAESSTSKLSEPGNIAGNDIAQSINPAKFIVHHSGHKLEQELQDWADGIMMRSRLSKIRGRARFIGSTGIKPGDTVKLSGVGNRFNGKAFVTAVRHEIGEGTWETQIQFGLDPDSHTAKFKDIHDHASSQLVGVVQGMQIGKVVQLQNDPDGEDRILVKIPVLDENANGIWTRVASLDAGQDRGAFFRPEIGDEVIIGFINNDPRDAVMLGMLHSSAKAAPISAKDENHEKGFTTRSKMHLSFNDQTKTITIDTPAGNKIILDEQGQKIEIEDQSKNKVTMSVSGIKLESPINVEVSAGVNLSLKAGAALTIEAANLSVKGSGNVSIEGAMAKLAGSGSTIISGGVVKIN